LGDIVQYDDWWMGNSKLTKLKDLINAINFGEFFRSASK
jgi:hypothetical protein